jgi:tetratricopeptide (TPR) repeat protein
MRRRRGLAVAAVALWLAGSAGAARAELRGLDGLVRVYDDILDARFEDADADLQHACGPAPREACLVLSSTETWWRIQLDPESRSLDAQFSRQVEEAIRATDAWVSREPQSAEAQFYAGAAYAARVQWRVLRGEKVSAARDGKRIKQALERAVALDPELEDAHFGIGMYEYYADVAPTAAKVLRFLLLLPGGDRADGLARMQRARTRGKLLQGEADYQLQIIYLWYEHRVDLAAALLESLRERYPGNPLFAAQLADVQDRYLHDPTATLATWRELLAAAQEERVNETALAETEAHLGIAKELDALSETDRALEQLRAVIAAKPTRPVGALASAYMALGEGEDRLGHHDAAVAAYRLAIGSAPPSDPEKIRDRAADRMRRTPDPVHAEAYRLSLEGLRKLERSDAAGAVSLLARAVTMDPSDPVARYRYGRALAAHKDTTGALSEFEAAIRTAKDAPGPIAASAFLEAARLHERLGHRDRAIDCYRAAQTWFGGAAATRAAARHALNRLHATK